MKNICIYGDPVVLKNYSAALEACGARFDFVSSAENCCGYSGLLLAGGGDMHPSIYGQELRNCNNIDSHRDLIELELIQKFINNGRPILGICRGMQVLNVAFGGDLIQELPNSQLHSYDKKLGDRIHEVTAVPGSFLHTLYGGRFTVNSAHHQGAGRPGKDLKYCAFSYDAAVEALECPQKKIYGVEFHPERMGFAHSRSDTVDGRKIFEFFLSL